MIARRVLMWLMLALATVCHGQKSGIDRDRFYKAMASENEALIEDQEAAVKLSVLPEKKAFEGALLMRKAGFARKAGEKLSLFKAGHKLLEAEIKKDGENAELRFLRLMIQENAPKILKYRGDIDDDSEFIKQHFNQLKPEIKKAVLDYSKKNKALKPSDFNQAPS